MAGHSKWANIKHKKAVVDAKRGKIFTRLIKEVTVAARMGGSDISANPRLRLAVDKARANNMPLDTIERAAKRGAGELDGVNYEEIRYEGYGPGGVPIIVDCMTDNRVRTVADVRHAFVKHGGNLGTDGSVAYLFNHCGLLVLEPCADSKKMEQAIEAAIEAGAEDIENHDDGSVEIMTTPETYVAVSDVIQKSGVVVAMSELLMKPLNEITVTGADAEKLQKMLDALENLDDVQEVYSAATLE